MSPIPAVEPALCSRQHDAADTGVYGTAAPARLWVALEQPGPWGRVAATSSHLSPEVGARLDAAVAAAGGRLVLIRTPGSHADRVTAEGAAASGRRPAAEPAPRTLLVARVDEHPWLLRGSMTDPAELADHDWGALAQADAETTAARLGGLRPDERGALLVCTNGRRDLCCARRARPVVLAAAAARPGEVWECSHLGGHRFAPTALLLPAGRLLARLDAATAVAALEAGRRGELPVALLGPRHDRGASALSPAAQAAESAVRADTGERRYAVLRVDPPQPEAGEPGAAGPAGPAPASWSVAVRHTDGRSWQVRVWREPTAALPESCGKAPVQSAQWRALPRPLPARRLPD